MKIQRLKEKRNVSKHFLGKTLGFTLVELIIVITILAILATIAFISFKSYSGNARDGNRLATIKTLEKGLEIYATKTEKYPTPEGQITQLLGTGGVILIEKGVIGENISKIINAHTLSKDPQTGDNYIYATTGNGKKYQIATYSESDLLSNIPFISNAYANTPYKAIIKGNYTPSIIIARGYKYFVPSLIFNYAELVGQEIEQDGDKIKIKLNEIGNTENKLYYVMNDGNNLPYKPNNNTEINNTQNIQLPYFQELLNQINQEKAVEEQYESNDFEELFLGTENENSKILQEVEKVTTSQTQNQVNIPKSCLAQPNYEGATFIVGNPSQPSQAWQSNNQEQACYWTCGEGKVLDDNACVANNCGGEMPDGTMKVSNATKLFGGTWNYNPAGGTCSYTCGDEFHTENAGGNCISNTKEVSCTQSGKPNNSNYVIANVSVIWNGNSWSTPATCDFTCIAGYTKEGLACNDKTPPTGGDFTLPASTNVTNVALNIACPTDAAGSTPIQMYISGSGLANGQGNVWESCTSSKNITLMSGNGSKAITIKWRDSVGNETNLVTKNISLSTYSTLLNEYVYVSNSFQSFVVPAGTTSIKVKAWGAGGGAGGWSGDQGQGGAGGYVESILSVTPGETLKIYVGQKGGQAWCPESGPDAGYGYAMGGKGRQDHGGAGGGSTEIHRNSTRLVVAGGGGGAGSNYKSGAGCSGTQRTDGVINGRAADEAGYSSHHAGAGGGGLVGGERMAAGPHNGAYGGSCLGDYVCGGGLTSTPCNSAEANGYGKGGYNSMNYACAANSYWATSGYVKIYK